MPIDFLLTESGDRLNVEEIQLAELLLEDGDELLHEGYDFLLLNSQSSRVTQAVGLVLYSEIPLARVTQAACLYLYNEVPYARVTQAVMLVLADSVPCIQRWAQCWKITRRDGVVLGFTAHDEPVIIAGTDYEPCASLQGSAIQSSAALGEVGNQDLVGIISDERISAQDLAGGVYQGARVEVWLYPWSDAGGELPVRVTAGYIATTEQGDVSYKAEVLTDGERLRQRALTGSYTASCRWVLGDAMCGVDLAPLTVAGGVTGILTPSARINASRRTFLDAGLADPDGYFSGGRLVWLTGANAGQSSEVKDNQGGVVTLWDSMLDEIELGDTYEIQPGCDKTATTCKAKYANYLNYGGFPDIPGKDSLLETPDAKG